MRVQFERAMETANDMFIREHKAWDIAKRLQEQNEYDETHPILLR